MTAEDDPARPSVPLSALEHYAYCARQAALIHVEGVWSANAHTVSGDLAHAAVDLPGQHHRAGQVSIRSLPVWSDTHALHGVCDLVEITGRAALPVEYKVGRYQPGGPADVQVAGQAICLREMSFTVTRGAVYSAAERRRHLVPITDELIDRALAAAAAVRALITAQVVPAAVNDRRCRRCSLRDDCLPEITHAAVGHDESDLFTARGMGSW